MSVPLTPAQIQEFGLDRYVEVLEEFVVHIRQVRGGRGLRVALDVGIDEALDQLDEKVGG